VTSHFVFKMAGVFKYWFNRAVYF